MHGQPKKGGQPRLEVRGDLVVGVVERNGIDVLTGTLPTKQRPRHARQPAAAFRLRREHQPQGDRPYRRPPGDPPADRPAARRRHRARMLGRALHGRAAAERPGADPPPAGGRHARRLALARRLHAGARAHRSRLSGLIPQETQMSTPARRFRPGCEQHPPPPHTSGGFLLPLQSHMDRADEPRTGDHHRHGRRPGHRGRDRPTLAARGARVVAADGGAQMWKRSRPPPRQSRSSRSPATSPTPARWPPWWRRPRAVRRPDRADQQCGRGGPDRPAARGRPEDFAAAIRATLVGAAFARRRSCPPC